MEPFYLELIDGGAEDQVGGPDISTSVDEDEAEIDQSNKAKR